jgi:hypothetical protein
MVMMSVVLLAAAICPAEPEAKPTGDEVLATFSQRVHGEVVPRTEEMNPAQVYGEISKIAAEVLVPHKDALHAKAKAELAAMPKATADYMANWTSVGGANGGRLEKGIREAITYGVAAKTVDGADPNALLLARFWSPRYAAMAVRQMMLAQHYSPDGMGKRAMTDAIAPPPVYAISNDPSKPILAIETGHEVCIVHLEYTEHGYYADTRLDWRMRKDPDGEE